MHMCFESERNRTHGRLHKHVFYGRMDRSIDRFTDMIDKHNCRESGGKRNVEPKFMCQLLICFFPLRNP